MKSKSVQNQFTIQETMAILSSLFGNLSNLIKIQAIENPQVEELWKSSLSAASKLLEPMTDSMRAPFFEAMRLQGIKASWDKTTKLSLKNERHVAQEKLN